MAHYFVIEARHGDDEWTDDLSANSSKWNCWTTGDEAWLFVGDLKRLGGDYQDAEYRVAEYAGPEDDERLQGYLL